MVQAAVGGAPTASAIGKKSDLNIYKLIEAPSVEAEMQWYMANIIKCLLLTSVILVGYELCLFPGGKK